VRWKAKDDIADEAMLVEDILGLTMVTAASNKLSCFTSQTVFDYCGQFKRAALDFPVA